ncbi:unnamed protein product [Albugo candida]|uniref:Uncharacterized protein n=1 Tax=Albugo candida TaxID=65357 RepID=A0A024FUA8_9STRA|nr:unnamed protein product [Albugo candida]|eukprot:CCI10743.1 unnamed protein product [Albugo candida]
MVSLIFVAAVLGLVTFGNAEVALRYLKSSSQKVARNRKWFTLVFKKDNCPKIPTMKDPTLVIFYDNFCSKNHKSDGCRKLYDHALQAWIEDLFGVKKENAGKYNEGQLAEKVQLIFAGYPTPPNNTPGKQSPYGFTGKQAFFLSRLAMHQIHASNISGSKLDRRLSATLLMEWLDDKRQKVSKLAFDSIDTQFLISGIWICNLRIHFTGLGEWVKMYGASKSNCLVDGTKARKPIALLYEIADFKVKC